jgi:putative membrane protein
VSEPDIPPVAGQPDARFSFANERTFLAWIRTALALIAAGLAVTQLLPAFDVSGGRLVIGLPLIVLGSVIAPVSYRLWRANEQAMRTGSALPSSFLPWLTTLVVAIVAIVAAVLVAFARD